MYTICQTCGKSFKSSPSRNRKFCSHACYTPTIKNQVSLTCEQCGTVFMRGEGTAKRRTHHFCGKECQKEYLVAQNAPNWQGGCRHWRGPGWKKIMRIAMERDSYTCQRCGVKSDRIELRVHHIVPFEAFNGNWEAANDLANLVTLCVSCHGIVETKSPQSRRTMPRDHSGQFVRCGKHPLITAARSVPFRS